MEYDFDQDELYFPIELPVHSVELLKSLPRALNPNRNDIQELVNLGFATPVKHGKFTSYQRTGAGTTYLKSIGQYD
jgi:hypothetical protein